MKLGHFVPLFLGGMALIAGRAAMTGFNMPPGTNPPDIPHDGEDDAFFELVWNKLAGRVPDDDVAEIAKWIADLIRDAREDGLWEA